MNVVSILEADMWEAILQSGRLIIGVLLVFGVFMAALMLVERGTKKRRRAVRPALRVVRCEKQDKAA